jgi:hypothetical protein
VLGSEAGCGELLRELTINRVQMRRSAHEENTSWSWTRLGRGRLVDGEEGADPSTRLTEPERFEIPNRLRTCVSAGQRRLLGRADSVLVQDIGMGCLTTSE